MILLSSCPYERRLDRYRRSIAADSAVIFHNRVEQRVDVPLKRMNGDDTSRLSINIKKLAVHSPFFEGVAGVAERTKFESQFEHFFDEPLRENPLAVVHPFLEIKLAELRHILGRNIHARRADRVTLRAFGKRVLREFQRNQQLADQKVVEPLAPAPYMATGYTTIEQEDSEDEE